MQRQRQPSRAAEPEFLRDLYDQIPKGIRPCDPILKEHPGLLPEQASAYFCGAVLYSNRPRHRPIRV